MNSAIFFPFIATFLIPGLLLALLLRKNKKTDFLLFVVYAGISGFAMQMAIAVISYPIPFMGNNPALRIAIAALSVMGFLACILIKAKKNGCRMHITISSYDIAALITSCVLVLILYAQMADLPLPYFNSGSDQYYWLAYAKRAAYDFKMIILLFLKNTLTQTTFFLILVPYAAFLPNDFEAYQSFIAVWQYGGYILITCAMARLAYAALPYRIMGIFAPITIYALHWSNYYMISTNVVPQNTALFLLIAGFVLLDECISATEAAAFIILFYFIHLPTLAMFILIVGTAKITTEGIRIVGRRMRGRKWKADWHIFESIALVPACGAIILYGLYGSGLLHPYASGLISYFSEYEKKLNLVSQPYADAPQRILLWLAILGAALIPVWAYFDKKKRRLLVALAFGFALPWGFLVTPLVAYHAFYASWQSFRYYLIMYPSIGILAILPPSATIFLIGRYISKNLAAVTTVMLVIIYSPLLMKVVAQQQSAVILDMIIGRDGGMSFSKQMLSIQEFFLINKTAPPGSVISAGPAMVNPYMQWIYAPRKSFATFPHCSRRECMVYDTFVHTQREIWNVPNPSFGLIQKEIPGEVNIHSVFEKLFSERQEFETYFLYRGARTQ